MSDSPVSLASLMTASKTVAIDFPGFIRECKSLYVTLDEKNLLNSEKNVSLQNLIERHAEARRNSRRRKIYC